MARFLKFFAALLGAFIAANLLYLFLLPRIDWDFGKTKEAYSFKDRQLNILVFGNSTAMDGINTKILSENVGPAYNFSLGGASLETNHIQLKKYLQQNKKPQKVLLFLSSAHTNYKNANEVNPIASYYYSGSFKAEGLKDIPLFKFRWLFVENIKKLISSTHRSARLVNGQLSINAVVADNSTYRADTVACPGNDLYTHKGYDHMWQIAALCKEQGIALEVFEMPCWKEMQNNCPDTVVYKQMGRAQYHISIRNLNSRLRCDTLFDPQKDWLSKNHLNHSGSVKLTTELLRLLAK